MKFLISEVVQSGVNCTCHGRAAVHMSTAGLDWLCPGKYCPSCHFECFWCWSLLHKGLCVFVADMTKEEVLGLLKMCITEVGSTVNLVTQQTFYSERNERVLIGREICCEWGLWKKKNHQVMAFLFDTPSHYSLDKWMTIVKGMLSWEEAVRLWGQKIYTVNLIACRFIVCVKASMVLHLKHLFLL